LSTSAEHPPIARRPLDSPRLEGLGLLLLTALSWGVNWPVAKYLLGQLPPFSMRTLVCAAGAAFAFCFALLRRERLAVPRRLWGRLGVLAMLNFGGFTLFSTLALDWLQASEAVIVTYTLPIWANLLAWPVLGERPTARSLLALALGLTGVAMLVGVDSTVTAWAKLPGVAMGLIAAVLFALGTVLSKGRPLGLPPVAGVAWQLTIGLVPIALLALTERPDWSGVTPLGWAAGAYVALLPLTLAYLAWFRAVSLLPASTAATGILIVPLVGVVASALLLGDPLGPRQLGALALALTGVGLAALQPRRRGLTV
jgi:probable blue pigment (indigoidine) exporter